ncbi:MAG: glycosyl transferase [Muribaculum sp.]|nr:glycosyl transferase [Muribaculum sp.]
MNTSNSIPKVIHYCWFGGNPLPPLAEKCIASWKKFLPDYEIKRWDETNFDVNIIPYTAQAYEAKKYAFVSDYARFKILYEEGGLYFDTDVEVIRSMDDIIAAGPFMGCENPYKPGATPDSLGVAPGLGLGVNPGLGLYKEILDIYNTLQFYKPNGALNEKTVVQYTTELLCEKGLKNIPSIQHLPEVKIYPNDYFCPQDYKTGVITITKNTRSIHHYAQSWLDEIQIKAVERARKLSFLPDSLQGYISYYSVLLQKRGICATIKHIRNRYREKKAEKK